MQGGDNKYLGVSMCISTERLNHYRKEGFTPMQVYTWNIELSEALYPLLHLIEISLRNRLHQEISILLDDHEWILNRNRSLLERLEIHWLEQIDRCILELRKQELPGEGYLISELNFGFWTSLLGNSFEHNNFLWPKLKNKVFPEARGVGISHIRHRFSQIRHLRNRIFHYGPIWNKGNLAILHDQIIEAIKWIEPELLSLIQRDRFPSIYAKGPDVKK